MHESKKFKHYRKYEMLGEGFNSCLEETSGLEELHITGLALASLQLKSNEGFFSMVLKIKFAMENKCFKINWANIFIPESES